MYFSEIQFYIRRQGNLPLTVLDIIMLKTSYSKSTKKGKMYLYDYFKSVIKVTSLKLSQGLDNRHFLYTVNTKQHPLFDAIKYLTYILHT